MIDESEGQHLKDIENILEVCKPWILGFSVLYITLLLYV